MHQDDSAAPTSTDLEPPSVSRSVIDSLGRHHGQHQDFPAPPLLTGGGASGSVDETAELVPAIEEAGEGLDRISIVAFTTSRAEAPYEDKRPGHEMWSCNNAWKLPDIAEKLDLFHRWFDVHPEPLLRGDPEQFDWLASQTRIVSYLERQYDEIPNGLRLPIEDMIPYYGVKYYTNTISYQLALAGIMLRPALERYKRWHRQTADQQQLGVEPPCPVIGVYGVDMATDSEYGAQRPSCEFFLGILMGAGFHVQIAAGSLLLAGSELYGLHDDGKFRQMLLTRRGEAIAEIGSQQQQRAALEQQAAQLSARIHFLEGQAAENTFWLERWTQPEIDRVSASKPGQLDVPQTIP
jgi:hypothetical protein